MYTHEKHLEYHKIMNPIILLPWMMKINYELLQMNTSQDGQYVDQYRIASSFLKII